MGIITAISDMFGLSTVQSAQATANIPVFNPQNPYNAASRTLQSMRNWFPYKEKTADKEIYGNRELINSRAWDLIRNDTTANSIVSTAKNNTIGTGLMVYPQPDYTLLGITKKEADEWGKKVRKLWKYWAESVNCDAQRKGDFYMLQMRTYFNQFVSGECFLLVKSNGKKYNKNFWFDTCLLGIDSDRIKSQPGADTMGGVYGGVKINSAGEELGYWIENINEYGLSEYVYVPKYGEKSGRLNVIHVYNPIRFDQRRGVSYFSAIMEPLKQLSRYDEAELQATVISALFTAVVKTELGDGFADDDDSPGLTDSDMALGSGNIIPLKPGEDVQTVTMNRPNVNFAAFEQAYMTKIASSLGYSPESVKKLYDSSYTAARAAMLDMWKAVRIDRRDFGVMFVKPIYTEVLTELILDGKIEAPGFFIDPLKRDAWLNCQIIGDAPGMIDPIKEIKAAKMLRQEQLASSTELAFQLKGTDYLDTLDQLQQEAEERAARGLKFSEEIEKQAVIDELP